MKYRKLACLYSSPPKWENMLELCYGCRSIWHCVDLLRNRDKKSSKKMKKFIRGAERLKRRQDKEMIIWERWFRFGSKRFKRKDKRGK